MSTCRTHTIDYALLRSWGLLTQSVATVKLLMGC
jgi:hypothetical protein